MVIASIKCLEVGNYVFSVNLERLILISKLGTFKFEDNARFKLFLLSITTTEYRRGIKLIRMSP